MIAQRQWGQWKLDDSDRSLAFVPDDDLGFDPCYWIDLETITSSAQMLDWIFQIRRKSWATASVMKSLLDALHAIFRPQENLCSLGHDLRIDAKEFLRSILTTAA